MEAQVSSQATLPPPDPAPGTPTKLEQLALENLRLARFILTLDGGIRLLEISQSDVVMPPAKWASYIRREGFTDYAMLPDLIVAAAERLSRNTR